MSVAFGVRELWLGVASLIAGGINALAGGGSLLSFPALLQAGVLPVHANATNTVALLPGQFTSAAAYRKQLQRFRSLLIPLVVAALTGGLIGAKVLLAIRQQTFFRMVPWLLLTGTILFAAGPSLQRLHAPTTRANPSGLSRTARILLPVGVFLVCLYVGFFGAGSGLMIMAVLSFAGIESVLEINALKTVITSVANTVAAVTFILYGAVLWRYGVLMMIAASVGGYATARYASRRKPRHMRAFVVMLGAIVTTYFFWKLR